MLFAFTKYEIPFTLVRRAYFALAAVASSGAQAAEVATKAESATARRHERRVRKNDAGGFFNVPREE